MPVKKLTAAFLLGASLLSGLYAADTVKPHWSGNSVVYGTKKVECFRNGSIKVYAADKLLLSFNPYQVFIDAQNKKNWNHFDDAKSAMEKTDRGMSWNLVRVVGKMNWKGMEQELEITPEGQLKIIYTAFPGPKELTANTPQVWFNLPFDLYNGKKGLYNGKEFIFQKDIRISDWSPKNDYGFSLNTGTPDAIRFKAENGKMSGMGCRQFNPKNIAIWYDLPKDGKGELILELTEK